MVGGDASPNNRSAQREGNVRKIGLLVALVVLAAGCAGTAVLAETALTPESVQKMSVSGLKARLGDPDLVIIDVRTGHDWDDSKTKIKGSVREDAYKLGAWINKYPKEKTIVFSCK
jgi:hypothetical protein